MTSYEVVVQRTWAHVRPAPVSPVALMYHDCDQPAVLLFYALVLDHTWLDKGGRSTEEGTRH